MGTPTPRQLIAGVTPGMSTAVHRKHVHGCFFLVLQCRTLPEQRSRRVELIDFLRVAGQLGTFAPQPQTIDELIHGALRYEILSNLEAIPDLRAIHRLVKLFLEDREVLWWLLAEIWKPRNGTQVHTRPLQSLQTGMTRATSVLDQSVSGHNSTSSKSWQLHNP